MYIFPINKITLFYTNICNLKCKHCFVSPLFNENQKMSNETFLKSLAFCKYNEIKKISISGGEPMLFWNDFKSLIKNFFINENIYFSICTNAYWAQNTTERLKILEDLKKHGVSRLEISTDSYHQEFISLDTITQCIVDAQNKGLDVIITICFENLLNEFNTIKKINKVISDSKNIRLKYVSNFGEAKNNCINTKPNLSLIEGYKCNQIGCPVITYTGNIYACCGPAFTLNNSNFYLGNINKNLIDEINSTLYNNKKIESLKKHYLCNLVPNYKTLFNSNKINSTCELCLYFMS
ncbi:radical SAM protein [Clostridium hydrogeniformans]|uniref:radical SAM protein n=1 Tax=Clostridium hydrogeniformans TaxID=349933 RepID=UPI000484DD05|nr:radical SAM protein [Clostridium hydrogeniformans]